MLAVQALLADVLVVLTLPGLCLLVVGDVRLLRCPDVQLCLLPCFLCLCLILRHNAASHSHLLNDAPMDGSSQHQARLQCITTSMVQHNQNTRPVRAACCSRHCEGTARPTGWPAQPADATVTCRGPISLSCQKGAAAQQHLAPGEGNIENRHLIEKG